MTRAGGRRQPRQDLPAPRHAASFSVRCGEHGDDGADPDDAWLVEGFASAEAAQDYARRFIRAQIEDLRQDAASAEALRAAYYRFGEYARAEGLDHVAWVAHCIATPATRKQDTDYQALDPQR
ncbi:hypothetical protein GCM10011504_42370 [Siccirubricoccus deserti]|uniref:Uncharacterized protein n=1 Tax=Siccirubricoccus deserti TaxID=2013562 RepID=A0A9X0R131_9PROT|nr:hypothetical protein [Siccirubricoccus deserti]MBC4017524.1 hypothetical protein [Siccirubricoccus deserti]GGC59693.1 hypothetical protein GCM10011504_42370 [Siccirubricoccus deserti]